MRYSALGMNEFSNVRIVKEMKLVEYDHADLDANFQLIIPVEPGTYVCGVGHHVTEAFTGGAATLIIGDSSNDDGWLTSALIVPGTLDTFVQSQGSSTAFAQGLYFASLGSIVVQGATGLTAGKGRIFIEMYKVEPSYRESM